MLAAAAKAAASPASGFWSNMLLPLPTAFAVPTTDRLVLTWSGPGMAARAHFTGSVYTDGSAFDVQLQGAARAGGAIVQVTRSGYAYLAARAPLPGILQGVPMAELLFASLACRFCEPPMDLVVDCLAIVRGLRRGKDWCCAPGRRFAQQWLDLFRVLSDLTWAIWDSGPRPEVQVTVRWVPAHTSMQDIGRGKISWLDHMGNRAADTLARAAALEHRIPDTITAGMEYLLPYLAGVVTFVASAPELVALRGQWPDVEVIPRPARKGGRPGQQRLGPRSSDKDGHDWLLSRWSAGKWQDVHDGSRVCAGCGARTFNWNARRRERCPGPPQTVPDPGRRRLLEAIARRAGPEHVLRFDGPLVWCLRCGYYSSSLGKSTSLDAVCDGKVPKPAAWRFGNLCKGLHPTSKVPLGEPALHWGRTAAVAEKCSHPVGLLWLDKAPAVVERPLRSRSAEEVMAAISEEVCGHPRQYLEGALGRRRRAEAKGKREEEVSWYSPPPPKVAAAQRVSLAGATYLPRGWREALPDAGFAEVAPALQVSSSSDGDSDSEG